MKAEFLAAKDIVTATGIGDDTDFNGKHLRNILPNGKAPHVCVEPFALSLTNHWYTGRDSFAFSSARVRKKIEVPLRPAAARNARPRCI